MATDKPAEDAYEIGYGKPPIANEFPNQIRKKVGRPLGSKNKPKPGDLTPSERGALVEGQRIVQAETKLTATAAVERAQIKTAVKGGTMAQKAHLSRIALLEQKERDATDKRLLEWEEYVRLCEFYLDIVSPEKRDLLLKQMIPHPDDVEVDFVKREVRILGPATSYEKREYIAVLKGLEEWRGTLMQWRAELEANPRDWGLQKSYTYSAVRFADTRELFPERYMPPPLDDWPAGRSLPWWHNESSGYVPAKPTGARNARARGQSALPSFWD